MTATTTSERTRCTLLDGDRYLAGASRCRLTVVPTSLIAPLLSLHPETTNTVKRSSKVGTIVMSYSTFRLVKVDRYLVPLPLKFMQVRTSFGMMLLRVTFVPQKTFARVPMTFETCPFAAHLLQETILGIRVYTHFAVMTIFADPTNRVIQISNTVLPRSGATETTHSTVTLTTVTARNMPNTVSPFTSCPTYGIRGTKTNVGTDFNVTNNVTLLDALRIPQSTQHDFVEPFIVTTVKVATKKKVRICRGWPCINLAYRLDICMPVALSLLTIICLPDRAK